jgi:hypothetical protein
MAFLPSVESYLFENWLPAGYFFTLKVKHFTMFAYLLFAGDPFSPNGRLDAVTAPL